MQGPSTIEFDELDGRGLRIAVVTTNWNSMITDRLLEGALSCLERSGLDRDEIEVVRCPGAFELPLTADSLLATERFDGIVALGAVIRGETPHFDFVASEASAGLMRTSLDWSRPVGFGLLTVDTIEQAEARSGEGPDNKGWESAATTLTMCRLISSISQEGE